MDFVTSIKTCFIKFVDFKGRASRSEFWYFTLFVVILQLVADFIDAQIAGVAYWDYTEFSGTVGHLVDIFTFLPSISVGARRLHDVGKTGWLQLIALTIVGLIPLFFWFASKTVVNENKYGAPAVIDPKNLPLWAKSLFSFVGIVFVGLVGLGVLAITGTVPNSEVVPGRELSSDVKAELVNYQILDPAEEVLYFYSGALFSFTEDGQLLTNNRLVSYMKDDMDRLKTWKLDYDEIDRFESLGDDLYRVYGNSRAEHEFVDILLSSENGGDKTFLNELRRRVR